MTTAITWIAFAQSISYSLFTALPVSFLCLKITFLTPPLCSPHALHRLIFSRLPPAAAAGVNSLPRSRPLCFRRYPLFFPASASKVMQTFAKYKPFIEKRPRKFKCIFDTYLNKPGAGRHLADFDRQKTDKFIRFSLQN
jgi:hypothetical protein